jgi:hypothetical protein
MSTPPKWLAKELAGAIAEDVYQALTPLDKRRVIMSIDLTGSPPEWFLKRLEARGVLPPRPVPRPLIWGMARGHFILLAIVTALALFGPLVAAVLVRLFK